jgi:5-methyltetrahydrofolate--homocysteine methyltransferase
MPPDPTAGKNGYAKECYICVLDFFPEAMADSIQIKCVYDPLVELMQHYADSVSQKADTGERDALSVEERLRSRIVDGDGIGLQADLDEALRGHTALEIINSILLDGMKTVGELFGSGQMQLPFVLQSAETMKAAVAHLEQFMERTDGSQRGTIVLATVKGDVHDIGKNLVDIILTNNGFKVVNLGIKVPVEAMLTAVEEHRADAIGMSGLLVKSTVIMRENLELMRHRGIRTPVILGGAALTRRYVEQDLRAVYDGMLAYANDAFDGLAFMKRLGDPAPADADRTRRPREDAAPLSGMEAKMAASIALDAETLPARSAVATDAPIPPAPFFGARAVTNIRIEKVFEYINEAALIRGQWQVRKGARSDAEYAEQLAREILPKLEELKLQAKRDGVLQPAVVYGYFPCNAEGNDLVVYRPADLVDDALHDEWPRTDYTRDELVEWQRFSFPRQPADRRLCLADFFRPAESRETDICAFHVVTMGESASAYTAKLFTENKYQEYLYMHGLSVECAEALAEYWHKSIRAEWGFGGDDATEIKKLFSQGYRGSRYSFGYPACPNLEDQRQLFALLRPERIGISLTEEWQLVPEQSTSAIIVHHPQARYFLIKD